MNVIARLRGSGGATVAAFLILAGGVTGCRDNDSSPISIAEASTCDELVTAAAPVLHDLVDSAIARPGESSQAVPGDADSDIEPDIDVDAEDDDFRFLSRLEELMDKEDDLGCGEENLLQEELCKVTRSRIDDDPSIRSAVDFLLIGC